MSHTPAAKPWVRSVVSAVLVFTAVGVWLWQIYAQTQAPNPILYALVMLLMIAAAYTLFGKATVESAASTAKELQDDAKQTESESPGSLYGETVEPVEDESSE